MQPTEEELATTYRSLPDVEIASLDAHISTLSNAAQMALRAEIERRHLNSEQLSKVYSSQLRHEANFDRQEKTHRRWLLSYWLFRNDPKGMLAVLVVVLALALLAFIAGRH